MYNIGISGVWPIHNMETNLIGHLHCIQLYSLVKTSETMYNLTFGHVMPLMLVSMLHNAKCHQWEYFICYIKMIKIRCKMTFWVIVTSLASALGSHDADGSTNGTIAFLRLRQLKQGTTWLFSITWGHWHWCHMTPAVSFMTPLHSLAENDWSIVQHDIFDHV